MLLANARLCVAAARTKAYPGSAAYRFQLRHSGLDTVMVGLALTTVLTTMWAIFGGIWRTTVLCGNAELACLCAFCRQGGIPRHM
jgi:hypothetical protein